MTKSNPLKKGMKSSQLEVKFELLLELAPDAVVIVNRDGHIMLVNAQTETMFGYHRDELLGQSVEVLVPEQLRAMHVQHRNGYVSDPKTRPMGAGSELAGRRKDGSAFPVEISLSPMETEEGVLVTSIIRNITERKRVEEEIRRLNHELEQRVLQRTAQLERLRDRAEQYLEVAGVVMVVIDKEQKVTLMNKKGCEVLGYPQDEILGRNWFDHFIPERIRAEVKTVFKNLISEETEPLEYFQNTVLTKSNQERLIAWHNTVLRDEQGKIYATLSSGEDITEKAILEQKVRHAEKLAAVGQLTSGLAHEIGTPLGVISGRAEYMLRKMAEQDPLRENLQRIIAQIDRITKIVQQLLSFTRPKPLEVRPMHLVSMLQDTFLLFEHHFAKQGVKASLDCPETLPTVMADPDQIQQVCLNLILNAIQAMPQGGRLTIRVRPAALRHLSEDSVQDGYIEIEIADTGAGIPSEQLQKIFDPFYSTKEPGKGTGLGLNISETIVKSHGGRITVKSQVDEGTVFTIFLPIKRGSEEEGRG